MCLCMCVHVCVSHSLESSLTPRRLLVFINPAAGKGKGEKLFKDHIQPMFDMAEINYTIIVTGEESSVSLSDRLITLHGN